MIWQFLASKAALAEFESSLAGEAIAKGGILSLPQAPLCITHIYIQLSHGSRPVWSKGLLSLSLGQNESVLASQTDSTLFCAQVQSSLFMWVLPVCRLNAGHLIPSSFCRLGTVILALLFLCNHAKQTDITRYFTSYPKSVLWYVWVQGKQDASCFCFNSSRLVVYLGTMQTKYISQIGLLTAQLSLLTLASCRSGGKLADPTTEYGMIFLLLSNHLLLSMELESLTHLRTASTPPLPEPLKAAFSPSGKW